MQNEHFERFRGKQTTRREHQNEDLELVIVKIKVKQVITNQEREQKRIFNTFLSEHSNLFVYIETSFK